MVSGRRGVVLGGGVVSGVRGWFWGVVLRMGWFYSNKLYQHFSSLPASTLPASRWNDVNQHWGSLCKLLLETLLRLEATYAEVQHVLLIR